MKYDEHDERSILKRRTAGTSLLTILAADPLSINIHVAGFLEYFRTIEKRANTLARTYDGDPINGPENAYDLLDSWAVEIRKLQRQRRREVKQWRDARDAEERRNAK